MARRPRKPLRVDARLAGERLDRALVDALPGWSRTRVQRLIQDGAVLVDGAAVTKPGRRLEEGERVELARTDLAVAEKERAAAAPIRVLFADEHLIVVAKPAGVVVHGTPGRAGRLAGTVCEQVAERYGPLPEIQGAGRPGVVHRLDRGTSGVLVLGRTPEALEHLKRQFKRRTVEKRYLALVHGDPRFDSDWIELPIGRSKRHPDRMAVREAQDDDEADELEPPDAARVDSDSDTEARHAPVRWREARTFYEVRERFADFAWLACRPETGRTHQIRVHLTATGHPVVADKVYRARGAQRAPWPANAPPLERHALHAQALAIDHPATGERLRFEAPLPADLEAALAWLRTRQGS